MTEGYADASMSTIAARVGGSKGTLYNYFPSKQALFAAFMREECEAEATAAYTLENPDAPVAEALRSIGRKMMRFIFSEKVQALHRLVIAESHRFPELGRTFYEEGPREGQIRLAALIGAWMDAGKLRAADPLRTAEKFADLCKAGLYQRALWNVSIAAETDIDRNVDDAVAIFMAYFG